MAKICTGRVGVNQLISKATLPRSRHKSSASHLHTGADQHSKHATVLGGTEDLSVDELPASLLGLLLGCELDLVVAAEVAVQGAHEDHGDDAAEEQHNDDGVDNREPVDLRVGHLKVEVPTRRPLDVALLPHDVVRPDDLLGTVFRGGKAHGLRGQGAGHLLERVARLELGIKALPRAVDLVLHAKRLHLEANDAVAREGGLVAVVEDDQTNVVVDVLDASLRVGDFFVAHVAQREALVVVGRVRRGAICEVEVMVLECVYGPPHQTTHTPNNCCARVWEEKTHPRQAPPRCSISWRLECCPQSS